MTTSKVNSLSRLRELNLELTDILPREKRRLRTNNSINQLQRRH